MKHWLISFLSTLIAFCLSSTAALACTDFRLIAKDGTVLITRSLEFALDLKSNLMSSPRNRSIDNATLEGKPALSWKTKYGYLFFDGLDTGMAIDGMNEAGLAIEALYLPGLTQYQTIPAGQEAKAIPYLRFADWVLGNFKTVDEVKQALPSVYVFAQEIPQMPKTIFPLHFAVHDKSGKSIVIEFVDGKQWVYDNAIGVMTNSPTYNWHLTNLRNYLNLSPTNPKPVVVNGITFVATGQGAGMLGLPGDISPPSRFVKIATLLKTIFTPNDADENINMAQHVINTVDIPIGFVREGQNVNAATLEKTAWVVFKDITHGVFYYRTYGDLSLRAVEMAKVNLAEGSPQLKMPITSKQNVLNMTEQFVGTGK